MREKAELEEIVEFEDSKNHDLGARIEVLREREKPSCKSGGKRGFPF